LAVGAVVGLFVRRRARRAWAFTAYLALNASWGLVVVLAPTVIAWRSWLAKEFALGLLTLTIAIEIALRVFARAPQAFRFARLVLAGILATTALFLVLDLPRPERPPFVQTSPAEIAAFETALALLPRLAYGSAWLLAALFMLSTSDRLPFDPLHRVIVIGLGVYVVLYAVTLAPLHDALGARVVSDVLTCTYLSTLAVWTFAAWRPERHDGRPDVVHHFFPWTR
jgi:hypothetical protein